jgi:manganese transport protein
MIPLVVFTAQRSRMGEFVAPPWLTVLSALIAVVIVGLNGLLIFNLWLSA